ncbi:MAG TPA: BamA/TamA family outer membrane protein [Burkholderiaceae bacterium]|jgi:translocation and assembly module TamA
MTAARAIAALAVAVTMMTFAGCASLSSFFSGKPAGDASAAPDAAASSAAAPRLEYRLEVDAPDPLRKLLTSYLDLARFQHAPASEAIDTAELERLKRAAPAQARQLLETEGYFNASVTLPATPNDESGLPRVRIVVEPGPRAIVGALTIEAAGPLETHDPAHELEQLRGQWTLPVGAAFRQGDWSAAKSAALARLRADGYAAANWTRTNARVDATENRVELALVVDSGPLYHLGALRIEGLERYRESTVSELANFDPGDAYSEKLLLDFQERLQKLGLFEGASVVLDPDPAHADAASVIVHVKEQTLHTATIGLGYSADTGPRVSLEHTDRRVFGTPWVAHNKFQLGPDQKTWEGELTSYPLDGLYRNLVSGSASQLRADDQVQLSWSARLGRTQDTPRIERLYFGELTHARVDSATLTTIGDAVSYNYQWVYRALDNVLLPTRGLTTSAQAAVGYAKGSLAALGLPTAESRGPFSRLYTRFTFYEPFGDAWYGTARLELGEVFTHNPIGIPDTLLFRAGGDDSVRGYAYRTLGPTVDGVTVSGRSLFTTSVEIARPVSKAYPAYWWAVFVDAGNAANSFVGMNPALGYGVGLRWRSPVGPLRIDLSYGQQTHQIRTDFSVGIAF